MTGETKIWMLKNCDICRNAMKVLESQFDTVKRVDVRDDGVDLADLARFYADFGDDILNRRSTTWRQLAPESREMDVLTLLAENPTLMKRPVIEIDGQLYLGWSKDV